MGGSNHRPSPAETLGDVLGIATAQVPAEAHWVDLVRSIANGDQRALHALYERAHRLVFTLSMRITRSRATAEEVTVDVFHDVWRRASTYDPSGGTVVGWIMNQAQSRAIDRVRFDQRKKRVRPPETEGAIPGPAATFSPLEILDAKEQGRRLREALGILTPDERRVIETAYFSELTYIEVAAQLNQPVGTVKTRIRSGLGKLREVLEGGEVKEL